MRKRVSLNKLKYIAILVILVLSLVPIHALPASALGGGLSDGDIVVADANGAGYTGTPAGSGRIIKVDPDTGAQTVISSGGMLDYPWSVAIDAAGDIIVSQRADSYGKPTSTGSIVRIDPATGAQTLISSGGNFTCPQGLIIDSAGDIILADRTAFGDGGIIKVDPLTGAQTQIASGGSILWPSDVTIDSDGNLYVTSATNKYTAKPYVIVKVNPADGMQTVVATVDVTNFYEGLIIDPTGNIFATCVYANGIVKIPAGGGPETLFASGYPFQDPWDLTFDAEGNLIVADGNWAWPGKIIKVNPTGVKTVISSGGLLVDPNGIVIVKEDPEPEDTTPPVVTPPADVTEEATGILTTIDIGEATATDDVGVVTLTNDDATGTFPLGTTIVTWTATDAANNVGTATQSVTVEDTTAPVPNEESLPTVTGLGSVTITAIPTASDTYAGTVIGTPDGPLTFTEVGMYTVTWTYADGNGNSTTQTQQVVVLTAQDATENLIDDLASLDLPGGTENSLTSKLESAMNSLENSQENAAVNKLNAFINQVEALSGKKIDSSDAQQLIDAVEEIITFLSG